MPETSPPRIPDAIWSPLASGLSMLMIGLIGLASGTLLLFPSLGPSAVMQAHSPSHPNTKPYNVLVGHLGGMACAYIAVAIFGLERSPSIFQMHHLTLPRVGASALALTLAMLLEIGLHSTHPPAASTTLLVALGSFTFTMHDAATLVGGILAVAVIGEILRVSRLAQRGVAPPAGPSGTPLGIPSSVPPPTINS